MYRTSSDLAITYKCIYTSMCIYMHRMTSDLAIMYDCVYIIFFLLSNNR